MRVSLSDTNELRLYFPGDLFYKYIGSLRAWHLIRQNRWPLIIGSEM